MTMEQSRLTGALQENILTLLCFSDDAAKLIRTKVTPALFESSVYREVAGIALDFVDQFGTAVKEHLPDHLEGILNGEDKRKASSYQRLIDNLFAAKDSTNEAYVMGQLTAFVRQQNLKSAVIKAVEAIEDGRIDLAEVELEKGLNSQIVNHDPGLNFSSAEDVMAVLDMPEEEGFDLGIEAFDRRGIIPRRKELFTFMAPRGKGKSWFLTHVAKMGLLQRWSGLIVTLEMSERRYAGRMLQSFFSISKRDASVRVPVLVQKDGVLDEVVFDQIERLTLTDPDLRTKLASRIKREFRRRPAFHIKEFPTKTLTINGLTSYLDSLERFSKYTPDFICLDYPDLMAMDSDNLRIELGEVMAKLRGIAVNRNLAVIAVTQGNRESEKAKTVTGDMVAEDISKLAISDTLVTYSQTPVEKQLGLARLLAYKARNEESGIMTLITQAYGMGQFALDSMELHGDQYWNVLNPGGGGEDHDDRDSLPRTNRRRERK